MAAPRLPILVRQNEVFARVVAGKGYREICAELGISEDTVARDMAAVALEVGELVRARTDEILSFAIAQLGEVIAAAWADYHAEAQREREWWAGQLDYEVTEIRSKGVAAGEVDPDAGAEVAAAQALEITEKRSIRRPALHTNKAQYYTVILAATRQLTELVGLQKIVLEHQGKGGGPIEVDDVAMSAAARELAEWRREMSERLSSLQSVSPMPPIS